MSLIGSEVISLIVFLHESGREPGAHGQTGTELEYAGVTMHPFDW